MSARDVIAEHVGMTGPDRDAAAAILTALRAAGYAVVPVEPTEAMKSAGRKPLLVIWDAMLAASDPDA